MDVSSLCRSCMKEVASWEKGNFDQSAVDMFCYCTHVKIQDDDKLPKQFCYDCFIKIESSYTFIKEAEKVNVTLRNIVSRDQTSIIVETDSLLKSLTPTPFTPKSILSLPDYELNYSNFNEENFFPDQELKQAIEVTNQPDNSELAEPNNKVMQEFQNEYDFANQCEPYEQITSQTEEIPEELVTENIDLPETENISNTVEKPEDNSKNFSCPICRKGFTFKAWLDRHLAKEHTDPNFSCNECNKSFTKRHQLQEHAICHSSERAFCCSVCGARFKKRKQLTEHTRRHDDARPYRCGQCDSSFKVKSLLTSHMKLHSSEKPYLCWVCGMSFAHAGNLKVHMRTHTGSKPHKCAECNFKCSVASSLRRHEARHREAPAHCCTQCRKTFYDASGLARHMRTHSGQLPYRCGACGRRFIDSWKRKTHLMRRHRLQLHDIPPMDRHGDRL